MSLGLKGDNDGGALEGLLTSLQEAGERRAVLQVHRLGTGWAHYSELDMGSVESVPELMEMIRANFGAGKWKIILYGPASQYLKSAVFNIDPGPGVAPAVPGQASGGGDSSRLDRLERLLEEQAARKGDGLEVSKVATEMMTAMMGAIAPLMAAVASQKQAGTAELVSVLTAGLELGREARGGEDSSPYGPMMRELVAGFRGAAPAAGVATLPAGAPAPAQAEPNPAPPDDAPAWVAQVAEYLPSLLRTAEDGEDPEAVAAALEELLPDELLDKLCLDPAAIAHLEDALPALRRHRRWVANVLERLQDDGSGAEEGQGEEEASDDAEGAPAPEPAAAEAATVHAGESETR